MYEAKSADKYIHIGKLFGLCVEQGSELPDGDERKKYNMTPIKKDEAREVLKKLVPISYNYKSNSKASSGLSAQQVRTVLPDLVKEDSEGILSVDYLGLMGYIIASLQ